MLLLRHNRSMETETKPNRLRYRHDKTIREETTMSESQTEKDQVSIRLFNANGHEVNLRVVIDGIPTFFTPIWVSLDGAICVKRDNGKVLRLTKGDNGY